jgi:hypothetical protein
MAAEVVSQKATNFTAINPALMASEAEMARRRTLRLSVAGESMRLFGESPLSSLTLKI